MKTSVFNEDFFVSASGSHRAGQEHTGDVGLVRVGIVLGEQEFRVVFDAELIQERRAWMVSRQCEHLLGRQDVCMDEVLRDAIGLAPERWSRPDQMRAAGILKKAGWTRYQKRDGDKRQWRYRKPEGNN